MSENVGRILVVDDSPDNVDILMRRLCRLGYEVTSAAGGREAINLIDSNEFDLIILDIMMPEVDGIKVLSHIRKSHSTLQLPVIMATAKNDSEDMVEALSNGANDYVTKPIDFPVLAVRVRAQLMLKKTNDDNHKLLIQLKDRNKFIKSVFGRFISDDVVDELLATPTGPKLGGELRELSILFSDIRGFTSIAEALQPEQVVSLLNNYLGVMTDVIEAHGGTVNEFYGDGLLAFFGAPVEKSEHERMALQCALAMRAAMQEVNKLNEEAGLPIISIGMGINSGKVVIGNIGSEKRFKYGVIGSSVNIASRLQSHAEDEKIIVSRACAVASEDAFNFSDFKAINVKGLSQSIEVCELLS